MFAASKVGSSSCELLLHAMWTGRHWELAVWQVRAWAFAAHTIYSRASTAKCCLAGSRPAVLCLGVHLIFALMLRNSDSHLAKMKCCRKFKKRGISWMGHILRHISLLQVITKGRVMVETTWGWKHLQVLSDITGEDYVNFGAEDRSNWQKSLS